MTVVVLVEGGHADPQASRHQQGIAGRVLANRGERQPYQRLVLAENEVLAPGWGAALGISCRTMGGD